jgi:predicted N-acyltransferase
LPLLIDDAAGRPAAALPAYLKQHSQGEYVFDQGWADAWQRAGGDYYPKLQISVPFTPATGPRLLCGDHPELALPLLRAAEAVVDQNGLSSAHATFIAPEQVPVFEEAGWLLRNDLQFHWTNRGYGCFDDFLAALVGASARTAQGARRRAGGRADRAADRPRDPARTLGRVLGFLSGHRRAQMGAPLSHARRVRPDRRADGRQVLLVMALR